ncbi:MAG TPA: phosphoglucosamine mutase [Candidatus Thermoplasmatota archaeon]|nr:phosphoglucosamine mutase [Candidatus Thermoplasmatota archaeon]
MGKLFGTNGVRGFANQDMNAELALKLGKSLGSFLKPGERVLVGTDTRTSGPMLKAALTAGLLATGVEVHDAGVVPTPALQYKVKRGGSGAQRGVDEPAGSSYYAAGAVITASHNPPEFNGIKFIDPDGTEMHHTKEDAIEDLFFNDRFRLVPWAQLGHVAVMPNVNEEYVEGILAKVDVQAIRARKLKVVLDTSNGAGGLTAPYLLQRLGCHVITLNTQPDGTFPGHNSEPTPDNVKDLVQSVTAFGADLGVVQDGDADRCVFVDDQGNYVYGDRTLTLMAGQAVAMNGGKGTVVTPVSSSSIVEQYVKAKGGSVTYTRVGAPIVARKMMEIKALIGGEENGGLIWPEFQYCRDASMTLAKVVEVIAKTGKSFSQLLGEVPVAHVYKTKVTCPDNKKVAALDALAKAHAKGGKVDLTDGVKIFSDDGWVLVRPSGTEPIYRIFADAKSPEAAKRLAESSKSEIEQIISKV